MGGRTVFIVGICLFLISFGFAIGKVLIDYQRKGLEGTLLPTEQGRFYKAVVVLSYDSGKGEATKTHFVSGENVNIIGGGELKAGEIYISEYNGLRLVRPNR